MEFEQASDLRSKWSPIGGGFELAMSCDLTIAAEHVEFGLPEMPLGIVPDAGALQRLPRRIPYNIAMEMFFLVVECQLRKQKALDW